MESIDYYSDTKFCPECDKYVHYLMSIKASYCTQCGGEVRLFSKEDWAAFNREVSSKRPKSGRPRRMDSKADSA